MPLPGVVPFPPEFAQALPRQGLLAGQEPRARVCRRFSKYQDRLFLIDGEKQYTYAQLDAATDNLALNLLELGLKPLDRVVPTLPNCAEFVLLYFALQKIGAIPIAALVTHRFAEISQFVQLSGAAMCVYPERQGDFEFGPMIQRVKAGNPSSASAFSLRPKRAYRPNLSRDKNRLQAPEDRSHRPVHLPALGRHDRHSQADPAHAQRLRLQLEDRGAGVRGHAGFGAARRAADRAQPAARLPGHPGLLLPGRQGGAADHAPRGRVSL